MRYLFISIVAGLAVIALVPATKWAWNKGVALLKKEDEILNDDQTDREIEK